MTATELLQIVTLVLALSVLVVSTIASRERAESDRRTEYVVREAMRRLDEMLARVDPTALTPIDTWTTDEWTHVILFHDGPFAGDRRDVSELPLAAKDDGYLPLELTDEGTGKVWRGHYLRDENSAGGDDWDWVEAS